MTTRFKPIHHDELEPLYQIAKAYARLCNKEMKLLGKS